jgi:hypothetical protein
MHFLIWLLAITLRAFENGVLRKMCGPKKDKWRGLHNEQPNDLYCSPNAIQVVISRRMG